MIDIETNQIIEFYSEELERLQDDIVRRNGKYMSKLGYYAENFFPTSLRDLRTKRPNRLAEPPYREGSIKVFETRHFIGSMLKGKYQLSHKSTPLPQSVLELRYDELWEAQIVAEEFEKALLLADPRISSAVGAVAGMGAVKSTIVTTQVVLLESPRGNVVGYEDNVYYLPKVLGDIRLEELVDTSELPESIKIFTDRSSAVLYGLRDTYVRPDRFPVKVGEVLGFDVVFWETDLYSIKKSSEVIAIDQLSATELAEKEEISKHTGIIDLVENLVRSENPSLFEVASTDLHNLVWFQDCYVGVPKSLGPVDLTTLPADQVERYSTLIEGLMWLIEQGGTSLQLECIF